MSMTKIALQHLYGRSMQKQALSLGSGIGAGLGAGAGIGAGELISNAADIKGVPRYLLDAVLGGAGGYGGYQLGDYLTQPNDWISRIERKGAEGVGYLKEMWDKLPEWKKRKILVAGDRAAAEARGEEYKGRSLFKNRGNAGTVTFDD